VLLKQFITITYGGDVKKESHCARFWNVGSAAAFYLAEMGAKLYIIDRDGGLINENGFTLKK
jgi:FtsP/CotA-like multicopper oxidase with cupredoxin domain